MAIFSAPNFFILIQYDYALGKGPEKKQLRKFGHMRRFPEPQHFYAAEWQKWDFGPSGKGPRWALINIILVYFENLGLVDLGFEGSKSKK